MSHKNRNRPPTPDTVTVLGANGAVAGVYSADDFLRAGGDQTYQPIGGRPAPNSQSRSPYNTPITRPQTAGRGYIQSANPAGQQVTARGQKEKAHWLSAWVDAGMLRGQATRWALGIPTENLGMYLVPTVMLSCVWGTLGYLFDVLPSFFFSQHVAKGMLSSGSIWADSIDSRLLMLMIVALSLTPTILELFTTELATKTFPAMQLTLIVAVLFDIGTDAKAAADVGRLIVAYFVGNAAIDPILKAVLAWIVSVPILVASTVLFEAMFVAFIVAFATLLGRLIRERVFVRRVVPRS